jgi:hypothetical protein
MSSSDTEKSKVRIQSRKDVLKPTNNGLRIGHRDDRLTPSIRAWAMEPYILPIKPLVEFYGGGEFFHKFISGLGKRPPHSLSLDMHISKFARRLRDTEKITKTDRKIFPELSSFRCLTSA